MSITWTRRKKFDVNNIVNVTLYALILENFDDSLVEVELYTKDGEKLAWVFLKTSDLGTISMKTPILKRKQRI